MSKYYYLENLIPKHIVDKIKADERARVLEEFVNFDGCAICMSKNALYNDCYYCRAEFYISEVAERLK